MLLNRKAALLGVFLMLPVACKTSRPASDVLVSDVPQTESRYQSVGNCWIYATASWLESMLLTYNAETVDVAESYWTWWHWYEQIVSSTTLTKVNEGGSWDGSRALFQKYGWVTEADFAAQSGQGSVEFDNFYYTHRDSSALDYINLQLKSGNLASPNSRTPENVRRELNTAFFVDMSEVEAKRKSTDQTMLKGAGGGGRDASIAALLPGWQIVKVTSPAQVESVLVRVKKALNHHIAIPMSYYCASPALNSDQKTFSNSRLEDAKRKAKGQAIPGGGHLVVISDYSVKDVPGVGQIGFGEVSAALKEKALQGKVDALKIKNSWGVAEEAYTIEFDYLVNSVRTEFDTRMVLNYFVLPPGY